MDTFNSMRFFCIPVGKYCPGITIQGINLVRSIFKKKLFRVKHDPFMTKHLNELQCTQKLIVLKCLII